MTRCILFFLLCLVNGILPFALSKQTPSGLSSGPIVDGLLPGDAMPIALRPRDQRLLKGFPGQVDVFSEGRRTWIVRRITQPTRALHSAGDCLRAQGYRVAPRPLFQEQAGPRWGESTAMREAERLCVRERIADGFGRNWTDVSAWFWDAVCGRTTGPWWAVTVVERSE